MVFSSLGCLTGNRTLCSELLVLKWDCVEKAPLSPALRDYTDGGKTFVFFFLEGGRECSLGRQGR